MTARQKQFLALIGAIVLFSIITLAFSPRVRSASNKVNPSTIVANQQVIAAELTPTAEIIAISTSTAVSPSSTDALPNPPTTSTTFLLIAVDEHQQEISRKELGVGISDTNLNLLLTDIRSAEAKAVREKLDEILGKVSWDINYVMDINPMIDPADNTGKMVHFVYDRLEIDGQTRWVAVYYFRSK